MRSMKAKPAGAKGTFVKRVALSSTMGPGVKIEPGTLEQRGSSVALSRSRPLAGVRITSFGRFAVR